MSIKIGIIGGGASGMMAAITAASFGANVTIIDHSQRIGKKILSTGNGKCNFTNLNLSKDDYKGNHPSFVASAFQYFDQYDSISFFEKCCMPHTEKRDGYCYPFSEQASTVLNVLRMKLEELGVNIFTEMTVSTIRCDERQNKVYLKTNNKKELCFDKVILACGGKAFPSSGSDGSGYEYAKQLGHKIVKPLPCLCFLTSKDKALTELAGVRCQAKITAYADDKPLATETGELQFNKDNLSGIIVFQLSHEAICAIDSKKKVKLSVDLMPNQSFDDTFDFLKRIQSIYSKQTAENALGSILNKKVVSAILHRTGIGHNVLMAELSTKMLHKMCESMHAFDFYVNGYADFSKAQVTLGGVDVSQINEFMMSKLAKNVYIVGEMLDIDGKCGGYNLQWAWTSGYIAGCHSAIGELKCYESHNVRQK